MNESSSDGEAEYVPLSTTKKRASYDRRPQTIIQAPPKKRAKKIPRPKSKRNFVADEDDIDYRESTTPSEKEASPYIYSGTDNSSKSGSPLRIRTRSQRRKGDFMGNDNDNDNDNHRGYLIDDDDFDDEQEFVSSSLSSSKNKSKNSNKKKGKGGGGSGRGTKKVTNTMKIAQGLLAATQKESNSLQNYPPTSAEQFLERQYQLISQKVAQLKTQPKEERSNRSVLPKSNKIGSDIILQTETNSSLLLTNDIMGSNGNRVNSMNTTGSSNVINNGNNGLTKVSLPSGQGQSAMLREKEAALSSCQNESLEDLLRQSKQEQTNELSKITDNREVSSHGGMKAIQARIAARLQNTGDNSIGQNSKTKKLSFKRAPNRNRISNNRTLGHRPTIAKLNKNKNGDGTSTSSNNNNSGLIGLTNSLNNTLNTSATSRIMTNNDNVSGINSVISNNNGNNGAIDDSELVTKAYEAREAANELSSMMDDELNIENTNLFIGNLPTKFSDKDLRIHFGRYGHITSLRYDSRIRNYAFLTYRTHEQAKAAIEDMDNRTIDNCVIKVRWSRPKGSPMNSNRNSMNNSMNHNSINSSLYSSNQSTPNKEKSKSKSKSATVTKSNQLDFAMEQAQAAKEQKEDAANMNIGNASDLPFVAGMIRSGSSMSASSDDSMGDAFDNLLSNSSRMNNNNDNNDNSSNNKNGMIEPIAPIVPIMGGNGASASPVKRAWELDDSDSDSDDANQNNRQSNLFANTIQAPVKPKEKRPNRFNRNYNNNNNSNNNNNNNSNNNNSNSNSNSNSNNNEDGRIRDTNDDEGTEYW